MGRQHPGGRGARHGRDRADALGPQLRSLRQSAQLRGARQGRQRQHAEVSLSLSLPNSHPPLCVRAGVSRRLHSRYTRRSSFIVDEICCAACFCQGQFCSFFFVRGVGFQSSEMVN